MIFVNIYAARPWVVAILALAAVLVWGLLGRIVPWGVLAGFVLSFGVEVWQYATGAGLAQGTDVLCNTLGAAVGILPVWVNRRLTRK